MRPSSLHALVTATLLSTLALSEVSAQTAPESAMERLVREWTTGYAAPVCRNFDGSRGLLRSCVHRAAGSATDSLTAQWYPETGTDVGLVDWSRGFTDTTQAVRAVAELERALELRRLAATDCAEVESPAGLSRSSMWKGFALGVIITRFDIRNGVARVVVAATSKPEEMPMDVLCREPKRRPVRA